MLGMPSLSRSSPGYLPLKTSTMCCTASESSLGGACSAHALRAAPGEAVLDPETGDDLSSACVKDLHLSSALRRRATGVQCSGSVTQGASQRACVLCNEVAKICGAVVCVSKISCSLDACGKYGLTKRLRHLELPQKGRESSIFFLHPGLKRKGAAVQNLWNPHAMCCAAELRTELRCDLSPEGVCNAENPQRKCRTSTFQAHPLRRQGLAGQDTRRACAAMPILAPQRARSICGCGGSEAS